MDLLLLPQRNLCRRLRHRVFCWADPIFCWLPQGPGEKSCRVYDWNVRIYRAHLRRSLGVDLNLINKGITIGLVTFF